MFEVKSATSVAVIDDEVVDDETSVAVIDDEVKSVAVVDNEVKSVTSVTSVTSVAVINVVIKSVIIIDDEVEGVTIVTRPVVSYVKQSHKLALLILAYNRQQLYYYVIEPNITNYSNLKWKCNRDGINMIAEINFFEINFVNYIIKTNMEEYGIRLVLRAFVLANRYILTDIEYYMNFIPMFRSGAQKHPSGRIPFQLLLDSICCDPPGLYEGNLIRWAKENEECYMMIGPLAVLYTNCSCYFGYHDGSNLARVIVDYRMF